MWKIHVLKSSCLEKQLFQKIGSLIDNLNWKSYSERELLHTTAIQEPVVKTYEKCLWVIQKPLNYRYSCTKAATGGVLRQKLFYTFSQNSQENICPRVSSFNKVAGLGPTTLLKERFWCRCFPMNLAKLLRTSILKKICERLLLVAG